MVSATQGRHNGMTRRILAAMSEPKTSAQLAAELGESSVLVNNRLKDLSTRGYVERLEARGERLHPAGRYPRYWRKLTDHETEARQRFEAARRLVEAAGFVLVPRRVL